MMSSLTDAVRAEFRYFDRRKMYAEENGLISCLFQAPCNTANLGRNEHSKITVSDQRIGTDTLI